MQKSCVLLVVLVAVPVFAQWQEQTVPPSYWLPGSAVEAPEGTWTVEGSGADIWGTSDEFHYLYDEMAVSGDRAISCHVVSFGGSPNAWAKAGLMFRTATNPLPERFEGPESYAFCLVTNSNGTGLQFRDGYGQPAARNDPGRLWKGPNDIWIKLVREGDTFSAYLSENPPLWEKIDEETFVNLYGEEMYVGLAVTSHQPGYLATAVFDDVNLEDPGISDAEPTNFTCTSEGDEVQLSWINGGAYDEIQIYRMGLDGALAQVTPGPGPSETEFTDAPGSGLWRYWIVAMVGGAPTLYQTCSVGAGSGPIEFFADFDAGLPPWTQVYGSAVVDTYSGIGGSGALQLTPLAYTQQGSFIIEDLSPGSVITGFTASFQMLVGGGSGADGLSFNFADDLPDGAFGEEGAGSGLSICFDTFDNFSGEAPAIDVKYGGEILASIKDSEDLFRTGDYIPVEVLVENDGTLDLIVDGAEVFTDFVLPFAPSGGRFGFGARTGDLTDQHFIDDLTIVTETESPSLPVITGYSPRGLNVPPDAEIFIEVMDAETALVPDSVELALNGTPAMPVVIKEGGTTWITCDPPGVLSPGENVVTLSYTDDGVPSTSSTYNLRFGVPHYVGPGGNLYAVVLPPQPITWPDARAAAEGRLLCGTPGHLATITSEEEDIFLEMLRQEVLRGSQPIGSASALWVGGFQSDDADEPFGGWMWLNDEGPIPGFNGEEDYSNWQPGEPNDAWCFHCENYISIGHQDTFGWNDDGFNGEGRQDGTLYGYIVEYEKLTVVVDVKPDDPENPVNLKSDGVLPVAVLTTETFDAATVDPASLTFGLSGLEATPLHTTVEDVNGDGLPDFLAHFETAACDIGCGEDTVRLTGHTLCGFPIEGRSHIQTLGCPPYALAVEALQDVSGTTDVFLTASVIARSFTAPLVAEQVHLKSYDLFGDLKWTDNLSDVPMEGSDAARTAVLQYADLQRFQPLRARMQVENSKFGNVEILQAEGRVLLRPDLAVVIDEAPESAYTGDVVNIHASIGELNGDLGALANAYLLKDGVQVDFATGIEVDPMGQVGVVFTTIFTEEGTYQLDVVAGDVEPADYDPSNNADGIVIEVTTPPLETVSYYLSYSRNEYDNSYGFEDDFMVVANEETGVNDYLYERLYSVAVDLVFPIDSLTFQIFVDGELAENYHITDIPGTAYTSGNYSYQRVYGRYLDADQVLYFYLYKRVYTPSGSEYSYAYVQRSTSCYEYRSYEHYKEWGEEWEDSGSYCQGTALNPVDSLTTRLVISDDNGAFGGTASIQQLQHSYYQDEWDYSDPWGGYHDWGSIDEHQTYGSKSGTTTP